MYLRRSPGVWRIKCHDNDVKKNNLYNSYFLHDVRARVRMRAGVSPRAGMCASGMTYDQFFITDKKEKNKRMKERG